MNTEIIEVLFQEKKIMENRKINGFPFKINEIENREKSPIFQKEKKVENRGYI